jgi:hypothetical protein
MCAHVLSTCWRRLLNCKHVVLGWQVPLQGHDSTCAWPDVPAAQCLQCCCCLAVLRKFHQATTLRTHTCVCCCVCAYVVEFSGVVKTFTSQSARAWHSCLGVDRWLYVCRCQHMGGYRKMHGQAPQTFSALTCMPRLSRCVQDPCMQLPYCMDTALRKVCCQPCGDPMPMPILSGSEHAQHS